MLIGIRDRSSFAYDSIVKEFTYQMLISTQKDIKSILDVKSKYSEEELEIEYKRWKKYLVIVSSIIIIFNTLMIVIKMSKAN